MKCKGYFEKERSTNSSILSLSIPKAFDRRALVWLQSMMLQRAGHDEDHTATHVKKALKRTKL